MASTYALPVASHSHGRSPSQSSFFAAPSPARSARLKPLSPVDEQRHNHTAHRPHKSDMSAQLSGALRSPYALPNGSAHDHDHDHSHNHDHNHSHNHGHSHQHSRARSNDSTHTTRPFVNGKMSGRHPAEVDPARSSARQHAQSSRHGFISPIQETPHAPPPSWLELPEALTALLVPLPYLFASLAYPHVIGQTRNPTTPLPEAAAESPSPAEQNITNGARLLHALTLASATLLLAGLVAKIRSSLDQPLDRRKAESSRSPAEALRDTSTLKRVGGNILGVLLPFYAAMQLGGSKTALVLLTAMAAGFGALDRKPGKHTRWDDLRRTLRTRKATCVSLCIGIFADVAVFGYTTATVLGYSALLTSILLVPPPLPTAGFSLITGIQNQGSYSTKGSTRASLPKPSSPLISTSEDTLLTLASGVLLSMTTVLCSSFVSSSPSLSHHAVLFSTLSVASATALVFFSLPAALRSSKHIGLSLGAIVIAGVNTWEHLYSWPETLSVPLVYFLFILAISFDTKSASHSHSHAPHDHSHEHEVGHHLHGNHSRLSAFLIARTTPGSIIHSVMIEKDSRRIAYFGVLNLSFMLVQFFYGFVSGSLGLLTDSIHMLFDCAGLAVGLAAAVMSKWRPNVRFPYGYGKVDTLSGFANGVFLLLVSVEIIFDAFERLWEGHELQRLNELLVVSILGFLVNIVGLTAFGHAHHGHGHSHDHGDHDHGHGHGHSHDNENMQGIFLHILADALGSVAVIISTLLTKYYGWSGWDPLASCIIAILIFLSAIPLVKSSGMRLMLSLPADVEYGVRNTLQELSSLRGVVGYTVPKFWLEDEGAAHAEVHAKEHEHKGCGGHDHDHDHDHSHDHSHRHDHAHSHDTHDHSHSHSPSDGHAHHHSHSGHGHGHNHGHDHDHDHEHSHAPRQQRILGVMHVIAAHAADLEDVRERTIQFLKGRNMDVVVHVEKEGEGRCWCGGGSKTG